MQFSVNSRFASCSSVPAALWRYPMVPKAQTHPTLAHCRASGYTEPSPTVDPWRTRGFF